MNGPLDMRMDRTTTSITAEDIVNSLGVEELAYIISEVFLFALMTSAGGYAHFYVCSLAYVCAISHTCVL